MNGSTLSQDNPSTRTGLEGWHLLLGIQSLVIVLLSINRLSSLALGYVAGNEFLRWVDLNNMLILPLISVVAFYLLKKRVEQPGPAFGSREHLLLNLAFLVGVYLLAASYGDHEVTNYLNTRFCQPGGPYEGSSLCQIIVFNDDEFSHWIFFAGFTLMNAGLMLLQRLFPFPHRVAPADRLLLAINGLFIGAGVFANLAFEAIGLDLYIVALLALLAVYLLLRRGPQPLFLYYSVAFGFGLLATLIVKALS
jgi:hypothetical protein